MEAKYKEIPPLTKEEKNLLLKSINDPEAYKKLMDANMGLVLRMAKLHKGNGVPMSVLVERGKKGLIEAIEKFDSVKNKGIKFIPYAAGFVIMRMQLECEWRRARVVI